MDRIFHIVLYYLKTQRYRLNKQAFRARLFSDPNNEFVSISNTLDFFNIKNVVANVPKTAFSELPKYFLALINNNNVTNLVLASKTQNGHIELLFDDKATYLLNEEQFLKEWTGLIIAVEKNGNSKKRLNFKPLIFNTFLSVSIVLAIFYLAASSYSVYKVFYLVLSICGFVLSAAVIKEKTGLNSVFSKFCSISKNTDCHAVLQSKNGQFFKGIDLSDISIGYFAFISLSFIYHSDSILFLLFSIASLPVILYAVYQQYFHIKKWCPLCLGIAATLMLQFSVLLPVHDSLFFDALDIFSMAAILMMVMTSWLFIKPLIIDATEKKELEIENLTFRRSHHLFLPYYNSLDKIDIQQDSISDIRLGSNHPLITITIVTNPLCESCFEAHKTYMSLLKKYPKEIQINLRFFVPYTNRKDPRTQISERLLELFFEEDKNVFMEAFDQWYEKISIKNWFNTWGYCENAKYNCMLSVQKSWCAALSIDSTPAILINGKFFPRLYQPSDIENFIDVLIEIEKRDKNIKKSKEIHA